MSVSAALRARRSRAAAKTRPTTAYRWRREDWRPPRRRRSRRSRPWWTRATRDSSQWRRPTRRYWSPPRGSPAAPLRDRTSRTPTRPLASSRSTSGDGRTTRTTASCRPNGRSSGWRWGSYDTRWTSCRWIASSPSCSTTKRRCKWGSSSGTCECRRKRSNLSGARSWRANRTANRTTVRRTPCRRCPSHVTKYLCCRSVSLCICTPVYGHVVMFCIVVNFRMLLQFTCACYTAGSSYSL